MRIAVASGKGGTGKTIVSTSLAWLAGKQGTPTTYVDADVEEPNGHLYLHPDISRRGAFAVPVPVLRGDHCSGCGECQRFCEYNAIVALPDRVLVFPELCHSCGGCLMACPEHALVEQPRRIGRLEVGSSESISCYSAILNVGEARATPLIHGLIGMVPGDGLTIIDAPPGTSCAAMEVVRGSDLVLLVTEPTPFGLHDLELAVEMSRALDRPTAAVINRADLGDDEVKGYLTRENIPLLAEIPFLPDVAHAYAEGRIAAQEDETFRQYMQQIAAGISGSSS